MKRCEYCWSMVDDNERTCPSCGGVFPPAPDPAQEPKRETAPAVPTHSHSTPRRKPVLTIAACAAVILLLALLLPRAIEHGREAAYREAAVSDAAKIVDLQAQVREYQGDDEAIIRLADRNWTLFQKNETLQQAYEAAAFSFEKAAISNAKAAYRSAGYAAALEEINKGLAILPNDAELSTYYDLFVSCMPTDLSSVPILSSDTLYFSHPTDTVEDAFGDKHNGYFRYCMDYRQLPVRIDYALNGMYTEVKGNYFVMKYEARLCLYADGVLVFDSGVFDNTQGTMPFTVSLDDVRILTVETQTDSLISVFGDLDSCDVYLVDVELTRQLSDSELGS